MTKNYTPLKNEKPLYYSTTVENGVIVKHENDPEHAVYSSQIDTIQRRAKLWHKWLADNVENAYDGLGIVNADVYAKYSNIKATNVISYDAKTGVYTLDNGGWPTRTTHKRMNEYLPSGSHVNAKNYETVLTTDDPEHVKLVNKEG